ncbi:MAG TPA: PilZ domain-containing protein [Gammaproteobacteria bacterium]|nr:PilZ domain-containing protein [Gammaproteobacteria bacterium]
MSIESRRSPRQLIHLDVELTYPTGERHQAVTRDISDGGMFILISSELRPVLGELVLLRLVGRSIEKITLPATEAVVVHTAPQGIGLAYIFIEIDDVD